MKSSLSWVAGLCLVVAALIAGCPRRQPGVGGGHGKVDDVTLSADQTVLIVGETMDIHAMAFIARGAVTATDSATWQVQPSDVARMARPGTLQGLESGKVTVTATLDGVQSNVLEIEVLHAPPPPPDPESGASEETAR
ncbi:MAG: Ig-like domain-containing protein [Candidatus Brocadiaceae bacterium]|jgi:hypothetical protein